MTQAPLSPHAARRKDEMALTDNEVNEVTEHPDVTYPGDRRHGPGRQVRKKGRLCSVHAPNGVVITFLWSGESTGYKRWSRPPLAARSQNPPARSPLDGDRRDSPDDAAAALE